VPLFSHEFDHKKNKGILVRSTQAIVVPHQFCIAGVDEAGRGPLVGSVVAAAVILDPNRPIEGLNDSKKLSEKQRNRLYDVIVENAAAYCIAQATPTEIDELNILHATMLAMRRAIDGLPIVPRIALIDGNRCPNVAIPCEAIIGGDALEVSIGAASILAKVTRDRQLEALDIIHPQYGFAKHKGYPTAAHVAALMIHGVIDDHRRSFKPVRDALDKFANLT
jgi:ribonuclease HII